MKTLKQKIVPIILGVFVLLFAGLYVKSCVEARKATKDLYAAENQISELQGTVELKDGVVMRQAQRIDGLNKRVDDILGDNNDLRDQINMRDEEVRVLSQINASLREQIEFTSNNPNSNATVTVIRDCEDSNATTTEVPDSGGNSSGNREPRLPNLRVDFSLTSTGFQIDGHTTTDPAYAEATLTQLEPFQLNLVLTEHESGSWRALVEEVDDRLNLDISELVVNPFTRNERWYERFGVGAFAAVNPNGSSMFGPTLSVEFNRIDLTMGAAYSTDRSWGPMVGVSWRPFRHRR